MTGLLFYNLFLILYAAGVRLLAPFNTKAKQWLRGRKRFPATNIIQHSIWMHCASLGEFEQGRPLLEKIREHYPGHPIVLTFFSPSGYEIRKNYPGADYIYYLPADSPGNAQRLLEQINPSLVLWVKYEYWHYYLTAIQERKIPLLLISGIYRPEQPFFKWYGSFWRKMAKRFTHLFVQDERSAELIKPINDAITVAGDTRFDRVITIAEKFEEVPGLQSFCGNHQTVVAGSTWDADEAEMFHYANTNRDIKFIIAPHEITDTHIRQLKEQFQSSILYSELVKESSSIENKNVLVIDNIGMLARIYRYASVTFIGGGFNSSGIHNILEAAVYGKPIVFGPVYEKFAEARELVELGGAFSISNALEFEKVVDGLLKNTGQLNAASVICKNYVYSKRGATEKIMNYVAENRLLTR